MTRRRYKLAVLDDYQDAARRFADWTGLDEQVETTVFRDHVADPRELVRRLQPFDIVCAIRERTRLDAAVLGDLPRLKLIVTAAMRNAAIDVHAAQASGITVCGTGAIHTGTPELTWALVLALARNLPAETGSVRAGGWQVGVARDLDGATIGIIGLGRVGGRVAAVAKAFGMRGLAWSPRMTAARAAEHGFEHAAKDVLLRESDFVVLCLQLRASTRGIVGARELALMKRTAYLVNTSRGPLVDEAALVDALAGRRIAGAGIDAFSEEPLAPDHPFRRLPNVIATPHAGYVTESTYRRFFADMVEDIAAWLQGGPIRLVTEQVMDA